MDFIRAANRATQGRSIIALQSTDRERTRSRIVAKLADGIVTTPRAEAVLNNRQLQHYVRGDDSEGTTRARKVAEALFAPKSQVTKEPAPDPLPPAETLASSFVLRLTRIRLCREPRSKQKSQGIDEPGAANPCKFRLHLRGPSLGFCEFVRSLPGWDP